MRHIIMVSGFCFSFLFMTAGTPRAGTYGTELPFTIGTGARASGLGLAYTSLSGDPAAQYFNAAALSEAQWKQFQFFRTVLFDSKSLYHTASYIHPTLNYGSLGITVLRLDIGGIEERDINNQLLSSDMKNSQTRILLGYARKLHPSFSAGFNMKIDNQSFGAYNGSGVGLDLGFLSVQKRENSRFLSEIREGLSIQNIIEPTVKLDQDAVADPMQVTFGVSGLSEFDNIALITSVDLVNPRYSPFSLRVGQEVRLLDYFFLRAGIDKDIPTFGFGAQYRNVAVDYAYRDEDLGTNHRISLSISFGASTDEARDSERRKLEEHINTQINKKMESIERDQIVNALQKADSLYEAGEYEKAIDSYEMAGYWDPGNLHARARLTEVRYHLAFREGGALMQKEDYLQAIYYFRQALSNVPEDSASNSNIAVCEQRLRESRNRALLIDQLLRKAIDLYAGQRYADALLGFDEILKIDPSNHMAQEYRQKTSVNMENIKQRLVIRARSLSDKKQYDGAIKALEDALEYSKDDPMISAEIDILKGKREAVLEAERAAPVEEQIRRTGLDKKALSLPKASVSIDVLETKYNKGMRYFEDGNFEEATRFFMEIWTIDPGFHNVSTLLTKAYLLMGMQFYSQEQYEKAIDIWERALKVDPQNVKVKRFLIKTKDEMEKLGGVTNG